MWRCLLEEGKLTLWPHLSLLLVPMHAPASPCPAPAQPSSFSIRRHLLQQGPRALRVTSPPWVKLMLFQFIPSTWHQIPSAADSHAHDYIRILRGTCIWRGGRGVIFFFFFHIRDTSYHFTAFWSLPTAWNSGQAGPMASQSPQVRDNFTSLIKTAYPV